MRILVDLMTVAAVDRCGHMHVFSGAFFVNSRFVTGQAGRGAGSPFGAAYIVYFGIIYMLFPGSVAIHTPNLIGLVMDGKPNDILYLFVAVQTFLAGCKAVVGPKNRGQSHQDAN